MTARGAAAADAQLDQPEQARVLRTLMTAQVLSGAGLAAGVTVGALLARDILGSDGLAGVPAALFTIGSAGAAILVGRTSDRHGRRPGLGLGYAAGALGAAGVVVAAKLESVLLLLPALLVYGAGTATNLQARYAGADLAAPARRGRAVSSVLVATTLGAVVGPNVVSTMGDLAERLDLPRLAGPFILAAAAYGLAGAVLLARLHPDPLLLARQRAVAPTTNEGDTVDDVDVAPAILGRAVAIGGAVMVIAQLVMAAIMTMTPVHMEHHGHGLGATGFVIGAHIAGMYLPSPLTGRLVDALGPRPVAVASGITLATAGIVAAAVPGESTVGITVALVVLGLGWNLGLLSGTAMVTAAVPLAVRARTQGAVDLCVAVAGAGAGLGSGAVLAASSFGFLSIASAAVALIGVIVVGASTTAAAVDRRAAAARAAHDPPLMTATGKSEHPGRAAATDSPTGRP
jgi:MFS family permease